MLLPDPAGLGSIRVLPPELRRLIIKHSLPSSIITFHPSSGDGRIGGRGQGLDYLAILRTSQALRTEAFEYINLHTNFRYVVSAACKHTPLPPRARTELVTNIEFSFNLNGQRLPGDEGVNQFDDDATMALEALISDGIVRKRLFINLYDTKRYIIHYFTQSKFFRTLARALTFETIEVALGHCVTTYDFKYQTSAVFDVMEQEMIDLLEGSLGVATVEAWTPTGGVHLEATKWVDRKITFWPVEYVKLLDNIAAGMRK